MWGVRTVGAAAGSELRLLRVLFGPAVRQIGQKREIKSHTFPTLGRTQP